MEEQGNHGYKLEREIEEYNGWMNEWVVCNYGSKGVGSGSGCDERGGYDFRIPWHSWEQHIIEYLCIHCCFLGFDGYDARFSRLVLVVRFLCRYSHQIRAVHHNILPSLGK